MNRFLKLHEQGQSYWLDNLTRQALRSGDLSRRVQHEGLSGVTSNPKTFSDSVLKSTAYADDIATLAADGHSTEQIYELLAVADVQDACDVLRPVHDASDGRDGFVSLEVSPRLAHDAEASISAAKRLAAHVDRPNLMIKIPGTKAGVEAVQRLLTVGVNVNVTLLFSVERYAEFAQAFLLALERRQKEGMPVSGVRSVASFFLSRIDALVDELLLQHAWGAQATEAKHLLGKVAVANAKLAYQRFLSEQAGACAGALREAGASQQRLLWASTGRKNPKYRDLLYVEPLIGPDTVTTMPEETIAAFADHGHVDATLARDADQANETMNALAALGIDFAQVATQLENEGIQKFMEAEAKLLEHLDGERRRRSAARAIAHAS